MISGGNIDVLLGFSNLSYRTCLNVGIWLALFFRLEVLCDVVGTPGFLCLVYKMCCPFYDIKKWLGAPWNTEWKKWFPLGVCPCTACSTGFSWRGRGDFCLGSRGPVSRRKGWFGQGWGQLWVHLYCALDVLRHPFFSLESWVGSRDASGLVCYKYRAQRSLSPQGEAFPCSRFSQVIKILSFSTWSLHTTLRPGPGGERTSSVLSKLVSDLQVFLGVDQPQKLFLRIFSHSISSSIRLYTCATAITLHIL